MERMVKGTSMYPFLRILDTCVTVEDVPFRISPGDIVIYDGPGGTLSIIHRVISVDKKNNAAIIKGDNISRKLLENIPLSAIKEKVISVKREGKVFSLETPHRRVLAKVIAFLSSYDLTPLLFKARFVDSALLKIAGSPLFRAFRKLFYKDISFSVSKEREKCNVRAFINGKESAKAALDLKDPKTVLVSSYIRRRDRNAFFAGRFLNKIVKISNDEYGDQKTLYITDGELRKLVAFKGKFYFNKRIVFPYQKLTDQHED
ncbi:MAG: hypothetical protein HQ594_00560 [Candidatus Omnitrophica bacterium]|nr:hypothetical protein [Candidatus Omnitrophota bacterium]